MSLKEMLAAMCHTINTKVANIVLLKDKGTLLR